MGDNDGTELILVNTTDYQSAQALSAEANKIFVAMLKPPAQVDNHNTYSIVSVSKIENGLVELNNLLNNKASSRGFNEDRYIRKFILIYYWPII